MQAQGASLLEQHQQALEEARLARKQAKAKSKASSTHGSDQAALDKGQTWVPFDRDKDLQALSEKKSRYQSMLDGDSSLGARFHKG